MKSKEELNALKEEVEALNTKLAVLTEEELTQVTGGMEENEYWKCHEHFFGLLFAGAYADAEEYYLSISRKLTGEQRNQFRDLYREFTGGKELKRYID